MVKISDSDRLGRAWRHGLAIGHWSDPKVRGQGLSVAILAPYWLPSLTRRGIAKRFRERRLIKRVLSIRGVTMKVRKRRAIRCRP